MNNNIKNNISYILDVSIKNKGKFYAGVFFSLLSAIVSLLIPLILGSVLDILTKMEGNMRVEKVLGAMVIFIIIYTLKKVIYNAASRSANRGCALFFYQPKVLKAVKKLRRF